jgi:hypothetical protein
MVNEAMDPFYRVRRLATSLSDVEETTSFGTYALKVRKKLFARMLPDTRYVVVAMASDLRDDLVQAAPSTFSVTEHYRHHPWIIVRLDAVGDDELANLLASAHAFASANKKGKRGREAGLPLSLVRK